MKIRSFLFFTMLCLLIAGCRIGGENSASTDNLFNQPEKDGDSTCGVRQALISQKVLNQEDDYYADILAMWKRIYTQTMADYPNGMPKNKPAPELTEMFERPLPASYTKAAVRSAQGGPFTPPSSILNVLKEDGCRLVRYYVDEDSLENLFGADFVRGELAIFDEVFPENQRNHINASKDQAALRKEFINPDSYYIVVVNRGMHWIGITGTTVYDSLATSPVENHDNFGRLNGDKNESNMNSFTGLVMEIQKNCE